MSRPPNKLYTLVFIIDDNRVLLGYKKRGFAKDWWNGFGGKVHPGESVEDGAKRLLHNDSYIMATRVTKTHHRELMEESSLTANALDKVGELIFEFKGDDQLLEVHVFRSFDYSGTPTESEGMHPIRYLVHNV